VVRRGFLLGGFLIVSLAHPPVAMTQRSGQLQPDVSGDTDGRHAWMTAVYRDLIVRKLTNPATGVVSIDVRHELDVVTISANASGVMRVTRGMRKVAIDSPESLSEARDTLRRSDGITQLLALERQSVRLHSAPEIALLTTIAVVGSLAGDETAVDRLRTRALDDPLWFKPVPPDRCAPEYAARSWKACDRAQTCVSDDEGAGDGWLACQSKWFLEAERAWFDYLNCVSPVVRPTDDRRD
jgi:hypothetical protein